MNVNENFCSLCCFSAWLDFIMKTSVPSRQNTSVIQIFYTPGKEGMRLFRCKNHFNVPLQATAYLCMLQFKILLSRKAKACKGGAFRLQTSSDELWPSAFRRPALLSGPPSTRKPGHSAKARSVTKASSGSTIQSHWTLHLPPTAPESKYFEGQAFQACRSWALLQPLLS